MTSCEIYVDHPCGGRVCLRDDQCVYHCLMLNKKGTAKRKVGSKTVVGSETTRVDLARKVETGIAGCGREAPKDWPTDTRAVTNWLSHNPTDVVVTADERVVYNWIPHSFADMASRADLGVGANRSPSTSADMDSGMELEPMTLWALLKEACYETW